MTDYQKANELREKGQYLSAKDAEFIQKIYKWKAKNPKDSKAWIDAVKVASEQINNEEAGCIMHMLTFLNLT